MKSLQIQCIGYKVAADWYDGNKNEVVLVLPGSESSKKSYEPLITALNQKTDMNYLVLDYSGHGESPFELANLMPAQHFLEVITAFDWIAVNHPNKNICVLGTSYGGYMAAQLSKYRVFNKLVLRAPAIYSPDSFYTKWKDLELREEKTKIRSDAKALAEHPLLQRASKFEGKTLIIVHEHDEQVPKETTDAFINAFKSEVYLAKGFSHSFSASLNQPDKIAAYQQRLADWLNQN